VCSATANVQPYYAVPSQYLAIDEFPTTRNGKVDKRALIGLAESENCRGLKRLSVRNGGVSFNLNLPGTPSSIINEPSFKYATASKVSPPAPDLLSLSCPNLADIHCPADRGQSHDMRGGPGSPCVLDDAVGGKYVWKYQQILDSK
jgi:hypothetical protein